MNQIRLPDRLTFAVGFATTIGLTGASAAPWIVDALVATHRFDIEQASRIEALEKAATGVALLLVSPIINRLSHRFLALTGVLLVVIAQLISTQMGDLPTLGAARVASGVGLGLIYGVASATGARAAEPDRTYAAAGVIQLLICVALNPILGFGSEMAGPRGIFIALAAWCVVLALPLFLTMPTDRVARSATGAGTKEPNASLSAVAVGGVLMIMALFSMANGAVYNFFAVIPNSFGLSGKELGFGLSIVSLVGTIGGLAANKLGMRWGRAVPLALGLVFTGSSGLALMLVQDRVQYYAAFSALLISFYFLNPYIFGLAAEVDPSGRLSSATASALMLVGSFAAWSASLLSTRWGYPGVGIAALALCILATGIALAVVRFTAKREIVARENC